MGRKGVGRSVGVFGFWEWTRGFQGRWASDGDGRSTDVFHLFEFGREAFLEVCTFVLLEIIRQEAEACHG